MSNMYSPILTEEYVWEQLWKKGEEGGFTSAVWSSCTHEFKRAGKGSQWTQMMKFSQHWSTKKIPSDIYNSFHCIFIDKR